MFPANVAPYALNWQTSDHKRIIFLRPYVLTPQGLHYPRKGIFEPKPAKTPAELFAEPRVSWLLLLGSSSLLARSCVPSTSSIIAPGSVVSTLVDYLYLQGRSTLRSNSTAQSPADVGECSMGTNCGGRRRWQGPLQIAPAVKCVASSSSRSAAPPVRRKRLEPVLRRMLAGETTNRLKLSPSA